jgi:RND family efflux transporter MFP subunit
MTIENNFIVWQGLLAGLTNENLTETAEKIGVYSAGIRNFLDQLANAVNALSSSPSVTATTISTYRSDISSARSAVNTSITNLTAALEGVRDAESALALATSELNLKTSGTRAEDVATARAQVAEAESDLASARDKIRKATLTAPIEARVMKIDVKKGETLTAGESAIMLAASQNKIQADVSELDIVKIPEEGGAETRITFDAFPDLTFTGKVVSIEPKEIIKDGDTYYRVNFYFEAGDAPIRSGMSSDLEVKVAEKANVLVIPDYAIYKKNGKSFVKVDADGKEEEVAISTGISNGELTEVIDGLLEGQKVIVSSS